MSNVEHFMEAPTPHNNAMPGDIAKTVLMPGDPLRAKYIAETYLENPVCFNTVRGMLGYTGTYKGVRISVMGSGMGMPSIGIYSYELYKFYGVENILRIGSCGGYGDDISVMDVLLAKKSYSKSTYALVQSGLKDDVLFPSAELNEIIVKTAAEIGENLKEVPIRCGDVFYTLVKDENDHLFAPDAKAGEMESFALFANAKVTGKKAACLLTVSDKNDTKEAIPAEEREKALVSMFKIALESAIRF